MIQVYMFKVKVTGQGQIESSSFHLSYHLAQVPTIARPCVKYEPDLYVQGQVHMPALC